MHLGDGRVGTFFVSVASTPLVPHKKKPEWRPDKPTVIKDSEAIQYVGKEAELRGKVVSVTISPLGKAFINFGGEYPDQTFAGFIEVGSTIATDQRITMMQGKSSASRSSFHNRLFAPREKGGFQNSQLAKYERINLGRFVPAFSHPCSRKIG
jgi:hypothetical protein